MGLGSVLMKLSFDQNLLSIIKRLTVAVKDAARHFVVASPSLTAPFKQRLKWGSSRSFNRVKGPKRSVP